ncbi:WD repeat-containing protein 25 [Chanos chanos]|uniref:WD repeat-containing protein 25 n=1 Tax=Chanos chanos TaxID=29144 RepID=A0A6J2V6Q8_CHACN|nr:WD repeat-containing protein 25 [Chanos chanos]
MASLVDYEDSDSEDASSEGEVSFSSQGEAGITQLLTDKKTLSFLPQTSRPDTATGGYTTAQYTDLTVSGPLEQLVHPDQAPLKFSGNRAVQTQPSHPAWHSSAGLSAVKRPRAAPAGVRPYVPKRQRTSISIRPTARPTEASAEVETSPTRAKSLTEVSERVQPFLGRKRGRTELSRHLLLHLRGHLGPVNTVQWCPALHLSHLLLSASMDKTVKVWDGVGSGRCLQTYSVHGGAVRDACWLPCGRRLLSGSFDGTAVVSDVETGQEVSRVQPHFKVTCLALQPSDPNVFLCGGFSSEVMAWDTRSCKMVRVYKAGIQQTLDILFLSKGTEFVTSTDSVSRDSADRTLIAWDFETTAKVSNQIFHERYTCPSLALHPEEDLFVAQTNGNYIALFSTQRPYRMNNRKRYEGHKVEGYAAQCEYSADGTVLVTGSSTGSVHYYDSQNTQTLHTLHAHQEACVGVSFHPVIPAVLATCDWGGEIKIWN